MSRVDDVLTITELASRLTPVAVKLIRSFAESLKGKTDDEILAEADTAFADVIAKAKKELGQ